MNRVVKKYTGCGRRAGCVITPFYRLRLAELFQCPVGPVPTELTPVTREKEELRSILQSSCQQMVRVSSLASSQRFELQSKCSWNDMPFPSAICWQLKLWQLYCCQSFKLWQLFKLCQQKTIITNPSVRAWIADSSRETLTGGPVSNWFASSSTEGLISEDGETSLIYFLPFLSDLRSYVFT